MKNGTNRLIYEPSIYLRQHAQNPVDWYPWGDEAFNKAISENKVVLVSIGYSACHWCHVMERESFEDERIADLMNAHFVNIKVDREERPDIDQIYMDAVQSMTGSGGWPLNVFLTPAKLPFYGGTYFPPVPMSNRPSWKQVILFVAEAYRDKKEEIEKQALYMTEYLEKSGRIHLAPNSKDHEVPGTKEEIFKLIMQQADLLEGGFGHAPKFPSTFQLGFLIRYYRLNRTPEALQQVELSLDKMIGGGIYDQIGGGFCRYSTDREWMVPHFEKMLYDNALLIELISEAYQLTRKTIYRNTLNRTLGYISREMADPEGGFFSAQDADSEGEEGRYYVWEKTELDRILGSDAGLFCDCFGVKDAGNWEGKNILWASRQPFGTETESITMAIELLRKERDNREKPQLDDQVLLSWNALMCMAYCKAYAALGDPGLRKVAEANFAFIWEQMRKPDTLTLFHCWKDGKPRQVAFLDDYAFLIQALISLQEITSDKNYLIRAKSLTDEVIRQFWDQEQGYFYFSPSGQQDIPFRRKEVYDSATPSGNAVMCRNLHYLSIVFDEPGYREKARQMTDGVSGLVSTYPASFGVWAQNLLEMEEGLSEIAVVGDHYQDLMPDILDRFIPFRVLMGSSMDDDRFPLLRQRYQSGKSLIYVCRDHICRLPVEDPRDAFKEFERV